MMYFVSTTTGTSYWDKNKLTELYVQLLDIWYICNYV